MNLSSRVKIFGNLIFFSFMIFVFWSFFALHAQVGSVDFFYYILLSRDWLDGIINTDKYFYFPGVFVFWAGVLSFTGKNFIGIQMAYVGILLVQTAFFILLCRRLGFSKSVAASSSLLLMVLFIYSEGFAGCTEPISTFFFLLTLLLFSTFKLDSLLNGLLMGVAGGVLLFTKQQAIFLVPSLWILSNSVFKWGWREILKSAFLFGCGLLATIFMLFLLEGGGISALKQGFMTVGSYEMKSNLWVNLSGYFGRLGLVSYHFVFALILILPLIFGWNSSAQGRLDWRWALALILGALLPMIQFQFRPYSHYGLLLAPCLCLLFGASLHYLESSLESMKRLRALQGAFKIGMMMHALWLTGVILAAAEKNFPNYMSSARLKYLDICDQISNQSLLLVPSRENVIFWICDVRSGTVPPTYAWPENRPQYYVDHLNKSDSKYLLLFKPSSGYFEEEQFAKNDWTQFSNTLVEKKFAPMVEYEFGTLYRRGETTKN